MEDFKVGFTYNSNTSGQYVIEALLREGKAIIRFHTTGNVRVASIKHMKTGEVADVLALGGKRGKYLPDSLDSTMEESAGNGFLEIDFEGNISLHFENTTDIDRDTGMPKNLLPEADK